MNDAQCSRCGKSWPRDPRMEVRCPTCNAQVGQWCSTAVETQPVGHIHAAREMNAIVMEFLPAHCPRPTALPVESIDEIPPCEPWTNQPSLFI